MKNNFVLIIGVTASGKGRVAFEMAKQTGGEIISIDSMKVYRRMDIGTAKPPKDARSAVPYHLMDIIEPSESFSAGLFLKFANAAIEDIQKRGKPVIASAAQRCILNRFCMACLKALLRTRRYETNWLHRHKIRACKVCIGNYRKLTPQQQPKSAATMQNE
jgi:hypothetical protein